MALEHCPNIKELTCLIDKQEPIEKLHDLFTRLNSLSLRSTDDCVSLENWFGADFKLQDLTIARLNQNLRLPRGNLPELKMVELFFVGLSGNELFFRENPQINKLKLHEATDCVEQPFDYTCFASMQSLRTLRIAMEKDEQESQRMLKALIEYGIPLEFMGIFVERISAAHFIYINQMKMLKVLHIGYCVFDTHTIQLAAHLPNLEELIVVAEIHATALSGIQQLMENAGDRLKKVHVDYETVGEPFG